VRAFVLGVFCLLAPVALAAETPEPAPPDDGHPERHWDRELNGHLFIPSLTIPQPFTSTVFSLITGAGAGWTDAPGVDTLANFFGSDHYVVAALSESVGMQVKIFDWWALRLGGGGGLFGGWNPRSALAIGATVLFDLDVGTTLSWQIGRYVRLGATFDFDFEPSRTIDPRAAVQGSLATGMVDRSLIRTRLNTYNFLPGATVAFAPHPAFGFVATLQYLGQILALQDPDTSANDNSVVFGAMAQLDVRPLAPRVPLGVVAGYRVQAPIPSQLVLTQDFEGGFYYTGRASLVLGLVARVRWFDLRPEAPPGFPTTALIGNVVVRYYWN
jgi:hypothetical protein